MSRTITVTLSEREAVAFEKATTDGRSGWQPRTSASLAGADAKILRAIREAEDAR